MKITQKMIDRFWSKVDKSDGCWNWKASVTGYGYGQFPISSYKCIGAHRFSSILHDGPIMNGDWILHRCNNPSCVNPKHLFRGNQSDNMRHCVASGRKIGYRKLNDEKVKIIRKMAGTMSQSKIGKLMGVSQKNISFIVRRITWRG